MHPHAAHTWPNATACSHTRTQQPSQQPEASTSVPPEAAAPVAPVTREFRALGSKVVESNVSFTGPEDQQDFWEGEKFEVRREQHARAHTLAHARLSHARAPAHTCARAPRRPQNLGKALENYFIPGLIALGLVCGGIAAKTYNEDATTYIKP